MQQAMKTQLRIPELELMKMTHITYKYARIKHPIRDSAGWLSGTHSTCIKSILFSPRDSAGLLSGRSSQSADHCP